MKTIKYINIFLLVLTISSGISGLISNGLWMTTLLLIFVIGVFQGITGSILFFLHPNSIRFQLYIGGLVLFLISCYLPIPKLWMVLPVPLLMYFTFMIHTVHQEKQQYTNYNIM
ncbi:hypothetical protein ACFO3O_20195 [Dokdonia ponticola]|uniref:Uncharacterized protein n=1 Tax=Dokdonia ponticola TaxID=2041041 RepID=A0ABV9I1M9_9FLAO